MVRIIHGNGHVKNTGIRYFILNRKMTGKVNNHYRTQFHFEFRVKHETW